MLRSETLLLEPFASVENLFTDCNESGHLVGDGDSPCLAFISQQGKLVVGTFVRGDRRRFVIANDSFAQPVTFRVEPHDGWKLSQVIAKLNAQTLPLEHDTPWQLGPGGCAVVELMRMR